MTNPFRNKTMRSQYDACVFCYDTKHRDLIRPDGTRHKGNSVAHHFWMGYDRVAIERWDRESRKMIAWAIYRAGMFVREREEKAGNELILK